MTIKTAVIQTFLKSSDLPYVPLSDGLRLQVLPDMTFLSKCQKHHFAAFVHYPPMLVVWDDDPEHIITRGEAIEQQLVGMIWNSDGMKDSTDYKTAAKSNFHSRAPTVNTKEVIEDTAFDSERPVSDQPRSTRLFQPILIAVAAILAMGTIGIGWRKIVIELGVDHAWLRLVFIVVVPAQLWLGWVSRIIDTLRAELTIAVLLSNISEWPGPDARPCQSDCFQLEILLWDPITATYD